MEYVKNTPDFIYEVRWYTYVDNAEEAVEYFSMDRSAHKKAEREGIKNGT